MKMYKLLIKLNYILFFIYIFFSKIKKKKFLCIFLKHSGYLIKLNNLN